MVVVVVVVVGGVGEMQSGHDPELEQQRQTRLSGVQLKGRPRQTDSCCLLWRLFYAALSLFFELAWAVLS